MKERKWKKTLLFLHKCGYTFLTAPMLTFDEVELLIEEHNAKVRDMEREERLRKRRGH